MDDNEERMRAWAEAQAIRFQPPTVEELVREFPEEAAQVLRAMGFTVRAPADVIPPRLDS